MTTSRPVRIQILTRDGKALVRVRVAHEMESGLRRDAVGRPIPAWHVTELEATLNGRTVLSAQWGPSMARNPELEFALKGARSGDRVEVAWTDNRGAKGAGAAQVP